MLATSAPVRTRMAPSPTGEYHVGHIATLLKNYALAKKHGGQFVLRIEDTDRERLIPGAVEKIMGIIRSFGLDWDEGPDKGGPHAPYTQSERLELYRQYADQLVEEGRAYYCFATKEEIEKMREVARQNHQPPRYDGMYRDYPLEEAKKRIGAGEPFVIRLKVPADTRVEFEDLLRGKIEVDSSDLDDTVLLKSDGYPTYHLAVVIDDHLMEITHILRGEEWIVSTPKHILLYQAFGWQPPTYCHLPVFLNPDGKGKMSKRKGNVSAQSFLDQGILPEALLNFLMILGWAHPSGREILTLDQYVEAFDPARFSSKSVVFDLDKLAWINGVYIRALPVPELITRLEPFIPADFPREKLAEILELVRERLVKLSDFNSLTSFFYRPIEVDQELLFKKASAELVATQLKLTARSLEELEGWTEESLEKTIRSLQESEDWHRGQYFMMLRLATTGSKATPPLFSTLVAIGRDLVLERMQKLQSATAQNPSS